MRTTGRRGVELLRCYLRAAELEMRAAEEPLRSDLDVTGLRAQVLGRIGELEARERERKELVGAGSRAHPRDGDTRVRPDADPGGDGRLGRGGLCGIPKLYAGAQHLVPPACAPGRKMGREPERAERLYGMLGMNFGELPFHALR